ncbi:MAG TPA: BBP7 family outer membrane beta-barrel protein, partial [Fimbriiglobus sp.]|nr:BBP7 family outer membrane beta-barrel protein [Fimbriiglobus sp.]
QFESVFATPLPPGPGTVPFIPNGKLVAPVLLPVGAPAAAPVAVYHYGPSPGTASVPGVVDCGQTVPCEEPSHRGRFWASADFLYGATQGVWVPPLVTMAAPGSPFPTAGALGTPSPILFGGRRDLNSTRPGLQARVGYWFDDGRTSGVDAGLIFLGGLSERFIGSSGPGGVVLARPTVGPGGVPVGSPIAGLTPGGVTASVDSRVIGGDVNYRRALRCGDCCRVDLLLGYRYLHLGDSVDVWTATTPLNPTPALGPVQVLLHDSVRTRNHFHGPQVGFVTGCRLAPGLTLETTTTVAMGVTVAEANAVGTTQVAASPGVGTIGAGLLVTPTNAVADTNSYFAVVPQAGAKIGYCLTDCLKATAGYTLLYWSKVRRASEQIDLTTDPAAGRPAFRNDTSDVWLQGWTLGVELRY